MVGLWHGVSHVNWLNHRRWPGLGSRWSWRCGAVERPQRYQVDLDRMRFWGSDRTTNVGFTVSSGTKNVETGTSSPTVAMFCGSDSRPKPFLSLMCHFEWWPCVCNSLKKTYTSMEIRMCFVQQRVTMALSKCGGMSWIYSWTECPVMASVWYHKWPNWYSHVMMVKFW